MFVEQYCKTKGGRPYFTVYYSLGKVVIVVRDITANDKESAKVKAKDYLKKAMGGEG